MTIRHKTLIAVPFLLAVMISAAGCGTSGSASETSAEETTAVETAAEETSAVETSAVETSAVETASAEEGETDAEETETTEEKEPENGKRSNAELSTEEDGTLSMQFTPADMDDYGYWHQQATVTGTYTFKTSGDSSIEWSVVVMGDEFDDAERYISQTYKEAMTGTGTILVEAGSWVYVYCSANDWTGETATESSSYSLTVVPEAE